MSEAFTTGSLSGSLFGRTSHISEGQDSHHNCYCGEIAEPSLLQQLCISLKPPYCSKPLLDILKGGSCLDYLKGCCFVNFINAKDVSQPRISRTKSRYSRHKHLNQATILFVLRPRFTWFWTFARTHAKSKQVQPVQSCGLSFLCVWASYGESLRQIPL